MERDKVYQAVDSERLYQDATWGGKAHDSTHSLAEWFLFIERHVKQGKDDIYFGNYTDAMHQLRKITGLCVAAGEIYGMPPREDVLQVNSK